jgi:hypothetical protein
MVVVMVVAMVVARVVARAVARVVTVKVIGGGGSGSDGGSGSGIGGGQGGGSLGHGVGGKGGGKGGHEGSQEGGGHRASEVESKVILMEHPISCCHAPVVRVFFIHCKMIISPQVFLLQSPYNSGNNSLHTSQNGTFVANTLSCFDVISTSPVPSNHLLLSHPIKLS